jgi:predicted HNH restriction endonuclease
MGRQLTDRRREYLRIKLIERSRYIKQQCIDYMGGCCSICGYNKCPAALEFHHKDPNEKDFGIAQRGLKSFSEELRNELDKCIILCSNCHSETHWEDSSKNLEKRKADWKSE